MMAEIPSAFTAAAALTIRRQPATVRAGKTVPQVAPPVRGGTSGSHDAALMRLSLG